MRPGTTTWVQKWLHQLLKLPYLEEGFVYNIIYYQWVLTARARPCAARTRLFGLIATPNGALRAPPPTHRSFAASYLTPKNLLNPSNLGRPRQGLFPFHRTAEAMKYEVHLPPAPPIATPFLQFLDLLILLFSSLSSLLFNFFLFFSSYLFLFFSQVLFFAFLFFSSYILNCLLY